MNRFIDYFHNGGFPEGALLAAKRNYLTSVYQKIYLGDIAARNAITNTFGLKIMIKKLAESIKQPISFNRIANIVSTTGSKLSTTSAIKYVEYAESAWLLQRINNIAAKLAEKESNSKYYFTDNGILNLFLIDGNTSLLENLVAISLIRQFGKEDAVFFYNKGIEVDFYIPEKEWAIQVSYSIKDLETRERETDALIKLSKVLPCKRFLVITFDEESVLQMDNHIGILKEVPEKLNFMATSCCPAWSMMAKTAFPDLAKNISMTMTPMVFTARMMKQADPEARMCFIGPCAAKKLEASRRTVRSDVDFVLTFEELAGIIEAKDLDLDNLEVDPAEMDLCYASAAGRGFAQSGGVAKAVADKIKEWRPDMEVKIASAQGLADCKKLLMLAKAGKYNGYLLEGMGCPGGCIGGAGTIADPVRTAAVLNKYVKDAEFTDPEQSAFMSNIHMLKDDPNFEV